MIYLSFMEILIGAEESLIEIFTAKQGKFIALFAFFGGMFLIHMLSKWVTINPKKLEDSGGSSTDQVSRELMRTGVLSALAIAIHNIPEGIAVSVPIYYATKSKKKAFMYGFVSGLAEPLGAIIGFLFLIPILTPTLLAVIYAMIAGIMVYISFEELIPTATKYDDSQTVAKGVFLGIFIMALSLVLM